MKKTNLTAAVLTQLGKKLEIVSDIKIEALSEHQVIVKILYTGICHSQIMEIDGLRGDDPWLPHCLGHEAVATVVEVGEKVKKVEVGDTVVVGWIVGEGCAGATPQLHSDTIGKINAGHCTTFSTYSVISENRLVPLPDGFPIELGALFGCAFPTGCGIVLNEVRPTASEKVLVVGLGGIGMSAVLTLKALDVKNVVCVDIDHEKLNLIRDLTGYEIHNSGEQDKDKLLEDLNLKFGKFDCSLDAAGFTDTIELAFEALRKDGRCVFASHPSYGEKIKLDPFDLINGKTIRGSWGGGSNPDQIIPELAILFSDMLPTLEKLVSRYRGIDTINDAIDDFRKNNIIRAIVEI